MPRIAGWALRGNTVGNMPGGFGFTRKVFDDIERFIADNQASQLKMKLGIDLLIRGITLVTKGEAQKRSFGPVAPRKRSVPALAYRIPVQRITGAYVAGWRHRRIGLAQWAVYNDSPEAYLIETGLHMRVRRPIMKMSVISMLSFIQSTRTVERFIDSVIAPRRNAKGQFQLFPARMQGSSVLGITGPVGTLP